MNLALTPGLPVILIIREENGLRVVTETPADVLVIDQADAERPVIRLRSAHDVAGGAVARELTRLNLVAPDDYDEDFDNFGDPYGR